MASDIMPPRTVEEEEGALLAEPRHPEEEVPSSLSAKEGRGRTSATDISALRGMGSNNSNCEPSSRANVDGEGGIIEGGDDCDVEIAENDDNDNGRLVSRGTAAAVAAPQSHSDNNNDNSNSEPMIGEDISRLEQECQRLRASMSSTRKHTQYWSALENRLTGAS